MGDNTDCLPSQKRIVLIASKFWINVNTWKKKIVSPFVLLKRRFAHFLDTLPPFYIIFQVLLKAKFEVVDDTNLLPSLTIYFELHFKKLVFKSHGCSVMSNNTKTQKRKRQNVNVVTWTSTKYQLNGQRKWNQRADKVGRFLQKYRQIR